MSSRPLKVGRTGFCRHGRRSLDEADRTVTCSDCGAVLDPFNELLRVGRDENLLERQQRERRSLAAKVAFLKGEERKVKARVKNAKRKDADAAVEAERQRLLERFDRARYAVNQTKVLLEKAMRLLADDRTRDAAAQYEETQLPSGTLYTRKDLPGGGPDAE